MSAPRTHELKTWRMYFDDVQSGVKSFEFRQDDRTPRFEVGDTLHLREWGGREMDYTGRECFRRVTYIARGGPIIPEGYCIMSIVPASRVSSEERPPEEIDLMKVVTDHLKKQSAVSPAERDAT